MTNCLTQSYLYSGTNMHKEYYTKDFPMYLKTNLLDKPRSINAQNDKVYFTMCTKACILDFDNYHRVLYHTLYLAFVY